MPGTNGVASAAAAQAAASPTRPGGTQFLVLDNIDEFQVVMTYTETDAAGIAPGQKVRLTFDAVPDLELTGSVLSVSPTATAISGVISYYVTVVLPKGDPRLKSGMTAQAEVLTKEIPGVLAVPSAAVHTQNGTSVVTVLDPTAPSAASPCRPARPATARPRSCPASRRASRSCCPRHYERGVMSELASESSTQRPREAPTERSEGER